MGQRLAIPVPGTKWEVAVRERHRHGATLASDDHTHEGDELADVFVWFAYDDPEDRTARAVCPELSLAVERPTVVEAVRELEIQIIGYIEDAVARGETRDVMLRVLPRDIMASHVTRLTRMLQHRREEAGTAWAAGHCHVGHDEVPATAT